MVQLFSTLSVKTLTAHDTFLDCGHSIIYIGIIKKHFIVAVEYNFFDT